MATMDELRQQWWDRLARDQRPRIKAAVEDRALTAETVKLLGETGCPLSAVGTQWEDKTGQWLDVGREHPAVRPRVELKRTTFAE